MDYVIEINRNDAITAGLITHLTDIGEIERISIPNQDVHLFAVATDNIIATHISTEEPEYQPLIDWLKANDIVWEKL